MAILNPCPGCPTMLLAGTRTPSRFTAAVGWQRHPILCSAAPNDRPGVPCAASTHSSILSQHIPSSELAADMVKDIHRFVCNVRISLQVMQLHPQCKHIPATSDSILSHSTALAVTTPSAIATLSNNLGAAAGRAYLHLNNNSSRHPITSPSQQ